MYDKAAFTLYDAENVLHIVYCVWQNFLENIFSFHVFWKDMKEGGNPKTQSASKKLKSTIDFKYTIGLTP